jgi:DNA damage-binding protein 1
MMQGVWSLRQTGMDVYDKYLVLTFVGETRLLAINQVESYKNRLRVVANVIY